MGDQVRIFRTQTLRQWTIIHQKDTYNYDTNTRSFFAVDPLPIVPGPGKGYGPPIHPVPIVPEPIKHYGPPIHPVKGYGPPIHPVPIVPPIEHVKPTYGLPPIPPPIVPVKPPKKTYGLPGLFSGLDKKPLKSVGFGNKIKLIQ